MCFKIAPAFGVKPREVKLGLGAAIALIALHRLLSAPEKQRDPVARAAAGLEEETSVVSEARGAFVAQTAAPAVRDLISLCSLY